MMAGEKNPHPNPLPPPAARERERGGGLGSEIWRVPATSGRANAARLPSPAQQVGGEGLGVRVFGRQPRRTAFALGLEGMRRRPAHGIRLCVRGT